MQEYGKYFCLQVSTLLNALDNCARALWSAGYCLQLIDGDNSYEYEQL